MMMMMILVMTCNDVTCELVIIPMLLQLIMQLIELTFDYRLINL